MDDARFGIGGNAPPPFDVLSQDVSAALEQARNAVNDFPVITDQVTADRFDGFFIALRDLSKRAEDQRVTEKAPHLEAGRAVDEKWNTGILSPVKKVMDMLSPRIAAWKAEQKRKREAEEAEARRIAAEAQEKARAAQAEADRLARDAAAGTLAGTDADPIAAAIRAEELARDAKGAKQAASAVKNAVPAGAQFKVDGKTRTVNLRTVWSARIVNPRAALAFFAADPRVLAALQTACDEAVRRDHANPPPGCEAHSETRV